MEHEVFKYLSRKSKIKPLPNLKKIRVHFAHDSKHVRRHKARLGADIHLADAPISSIHSGVSSLKCIGLVLFLAEINVLESWG